jgi:two-component system CheB/CheR fusion protein
MKNFNFIVGIGASAGGLEPIQHFFDHIPDNTGMSFVIVQHLSPNFKSLMPELLAKHTNMEITTVQKQHDIKPNHIYLNNRNKVLSIKNGKLVIKDKDPEQQLNLPIDVFFHSLGIEYLERSVAIVLSGTGSDGSRGIRSIKEGGGIIMVQDPKSAQFDGMPNSSIATSMADFILTPAHIAEELVRLCHKSYYAISLNENQNGAYGPLVLKILDELYQFSGIDFRKYKSNTILRRLDKRIGTSKSTSLDQYHRFFTNNTAEKELLKKDFLIGVTSFFRDEEAYKLLKSDVFKELFKWHIKTDVFRVWVAGCSTGEEAYSIAIMLDEYLKKMNLSVNFKIFATDVDLDAIKIASEGSYPLHTIEHVSKNRIEKYFYRQGDRYIIKKYIREKIVFSYHNIMKDPPFVRMNLVSCRNLLIYLNNKIQKQILLNFQFSLVKNGFLFLGSSESLGMLQKYFRVIDAKWKIFQMISNQKVYPNFSLHDEKQFIGTHKAPVTESNYHLTHPLKIESSENQYYKYLAEQYSPSCIIINDEYRILFVLGDVRHQLKFSEGDFNNNLLSLVPKELKTIIQSGIVKARKKTSPVRSTNVKIHTGDTQLYFTLTFRKIKSSNGQQSDFIIEFELENEPQKSTQENYVSFEADTSSAHYIEELEEEVKIAKNELQQVIEELETSNEELQSSNEELLASNEELQSTNEELQSVNEELYTVNSELQEKNKELFDLNDDVNNLLNSTEIGTMFLDKHLNIRKYTPAMQRFFHLRDDDIGRPISTFASNFSDSVRLSIIADSNKVLKSANIVVKEIKDLEGNHYLKRITPFISKMKIVEGVVITLTEINKLKQAEADLLKMNQAIYQSPASIVLTDSEGLISYVNPKFEEMTGYSKNEAMRKPTNILKSGHHDEAYYNQLWKTVNRGDTWRGEFLNKKKNGQTFWEFASISPIKNKKSETTGFVKVGEDVSEVKQIQKELSDAKDKAEIANIYKNNFLANMSHEIRTPMNGIIGFSNLLKDRNLPEDEKNKYIDIIHSNSLQLLNLIDDIIDTSKIEAGEMKISMGECNIDQLINEVMVVFENELNHFDEKKNVNISYKPSENYKNLIIRTDSVRLKQILSNLLNNAIKYTIKGKIELGYYFTGNKIEFFVRDTGIGIPKAKLATIFNRFERLDSKLKSKIGGTGLGLSISQGLVKLLGGDIRVESKYNKGSVFYISLPLDIVHIPTVKKETKTKVINDSLYGKKILIVEDDPLIYEFIKAILAPYKINLTWACKGKEAIKKYFNNSKFDLVLMDLGLPDISGFEVTSQILAKDKDAIVVAQTAYVMQEDLDKCKEFGFKGHIAKPILPDLLFNTMSRLLK